MSFISIIRVRLAYVRAEAGFSDNVAIGTDKLERHSISNNRTLAVSDVRKWTWKDRYL